MPNVILTNVKLCNGTHAESREYVQNSGRIAGVNDRVDLRVDTNALERGAKAIELNSPGVDCVNPGDVHGG
jgi:hypothetical protein